MFSYQRNNEILVVNSKSFGGEIYTLPPAFLSVRSFLKHLKLSQASVCTLKNYRNLISHHVRYYRNAEVCLAFSTKIQCILNSFHVIQCKVDLA